MRATSLAILGAAAVLLAGCVDRTVQPSVEAPYPPPPSAGDLDGVRGSLRVGPWANGRQEVAVWMETGGSRLGAYQARLRFETPGLRYESAEATDEGFRVLNDIRHSSGELRFAGFDVGGFENPEVLRIRFATDRPIQPDQLTLEIEASGTLEAEPVAASEMSVELDLYALRERR